MDPHEKLYWPFAIPPVQTQTEEQKSQLRFLEAAHQQGYAPYMERVGHFGAASGTRGVQILVRGRKHWQVLMGTAKETILSAHLDNFRTAAEAVLGWLRGADAAEIVEQIRDHLVVTRATGCGFLLHQPAAATRST